MVDEMQMPPGRFRRCCGVNEQAVDVRRDESKVVSVGDEDGDRKRPRTHEKHLHERILLRG